LELFDEKITYLNKVKKEINEMKPSVDIGWLRVSANPLIEKLRTTVNQWIDTYQNFLLHNTVRQIHNIESFIRDTTDGIKVLPQSADSKKEKELLMKVMTVLRDVKMIKGRTLDQIEPMKSTVMLLKKHQLKMEEDLLVKLENSKTALVEVSERALGPVKEQILPLQNKEASNIKGDLSKFNVAVKEFRLEFQTKTPKNIMESSP
jgi:hypothetical protein